MSGKIRVLHVIKTFNLGGAETNLLNLIRAFDPSRVETHVAYSFGGEIEERFRRERLILFKYADRNHKIKNLASVIIVLRLAGYILKNKIDIVHTHNFNAHVWAAAATKLTGRKLVEHVHDFRYIDKETREKGRCFVGQYEHIRYMKGFSDRIVVLTKQNEQYVVERGFSIPEKVRLVRNGIPLSDSKSSGLDLRNRLGIPEDHAVFLTPARISGEKNIDLIFQAAPLIAARHPKVTFLISGDGPLMESYRKRIAEKGLGDRVKFIGFYPDTLGLLSIAYALLLPSFLELHPISILEALSVKVPVLVSENVGCNSEVFSDWDNGILLNPWTPAAWVEAVLKLLENPDLGREIGLKGFKLCQEQFDIRQAAEKFEGIYAELV